MRQAVPGSCVARKAWERCFWGSYKANPCSKCVKAEANAPTTNKAIPNRSVRALVQRQELLPQLTCRLHLAAHEIKPPQSRQHWKELRGLSHLPAELACSCIGVFHFRGAKPLVAASGTPKTIWNASSCWMWPSVEGVGVFTLSFCSALAPMLRG